MPQLFKRASSTSTTSNAIPTPVIVNPTQQYDGDDGSWSTFTVQIGTPPQSFRVLVSTSSSETWVVAPEGCTKSDPSNCAQLRGAQAFNGRASTGFATNASSTWSQAGIYTLDLEQSLGYSGNGLYGYDVVGLSGGNSSGGVSLDQQTIAGVAGKDYFMGYIGLSDRPSSFSSSAASAPSLLNNLRTANLIPSLSFGYTAGAAYGKKPSRSLGIVQRLTSTTEGKGTFGSLTLGGYDQSRFKNATQSFSFASDDARPLKIGVQSIVGSNTLAGVASFTSSGGHLSFIDSSVSQLWLPRAVCDSFETSLGLTFDNNTGFYLVNDTVHAQLKTLNPTFTFKLGNTAYDNGNSTNIVLPYAAFDQQIGWPTYLNKQNYFPIRRAANDSQYTIGRTFLQEAYLVVDYARKNFSISQAVFSDPLPATNIITISDRGSTSSGSTPTNPLSSGAIAGIVIGFALFIMALAGLAVFFISRRRKRAEVSQAELEGKGIDMDKPSSADSMASLKMHQYKGYVEPRDGAKEISGETQVIELQSPIDGGPPKDSDLEIAEVAHNPIFEMMGDSAFYPSSKKFTPATSRAGSTRSLADAVSPQHVSPLDERPGDAASPNRSPGIVSPLQQQSAFGTFHRS